MQKKIYRSKQQKTISGVCGGIAEYFDVDVTLVRLAWVATILFGGTGLLLYIIAAIIIPVNPYQSEDGTPGGYYEGGYSNGESSRGPNKGVLIFGIVLIVIGILQLLEKINPFGLWHIIRSIGWAGLLIILGIAVLATSLRKK